MEFPRFILAACDQCLEAGKVLEGHTACDINEYTELAMEETAKGNLYRTLEGSPHSTSYWVWRTTMYGIKPTHPTGLWTGLPGRRL